MLRPNIYYGLNILYYMMYTCFRGSNCVFQLLANISGEHIHVLLLKISVKKSVENPVLKSYAARH